MRKRIFIVLATALFFGGVFAGGVFVGSTERIALMAAELGMVGGESMPAGVDFAPVWKVWHTLDEKFVDTHATTTLASETEVHTPTLAQERIWGMARGLAASTGDPYTVFMPPSESESFQNDINGSFEGVGMEIAIRDGVLTVVAPLKNTPAYRAGIKSGDNIITIDDVNAEYMGVTEAVERIRGPRGSEVVLGVVREGTAGILEIAIVRDTIIIPTIDTQLRDDGVFVIALYNFSAQSPELFRQALIEFTNVHTDKLIIDLRGNPGGYLSAAVDMASWFLPDGAVVVTEDYGNKQDPIVHRSRGYDIFNEHLKLAVLIDRGSASASEILAGALAKHDKATLVGTQSFGKGSVQELVDITDDTTLKVTIARWLFVDGSSIADSGITPDVPVDVDNAPKDASGTIIGDPILDVAVKFLTK